MEIWGIDDWLIIYFLFVIQMDDGLTIVSFSRRMTAKQRIQRTTQTIGKTPAFWTT